MPRRCGVNELHPAPAPPEWRPLWRVQGAFRGFTGRPPAAGRPVGWLFLSGNLVTSSNLHNLTNDKLPIQNMGLRDLFVS